MTDLRIKDVKSFPKASGSLFARTTRFDPNDPRSVIDTQDVFLRDDGNFYTVGGSVDTPDYFTSIIFEIPKGLASGEHDLGPGSIGVRFFVDEGNGEDYYRAIEGKITITDVVEGTLYRSSEFRFTARIGTAGKTVEVMMGKFDIS
ncbi:hypothetical protein [Pseudomonas paraglycinae]|uniref:hypothetical protein n=1 Tax=Pseudomonas paraglycinae TaxID=2892330 RepID=UPI003FCF8676